ncbi:S49 family peptidase [Vibrio crassostreae]|uniref:S49 family peptidase n=1 Tax=Vibrio crassostreae TaxID=246167 RepID=UPI0010D111B0|nr:S49 family peptidase [Vibrio crassostreae]TCN02930.1 protein C [Vibrio crassostreae]
MNQIISQFNQCPVLLAPSQLSSLGGFKPQLDTSKLSMQELALATGISHDAKMKPYQVVNGIAVIRIQGALIHNLGWSSSNYTGYDVIKRKVAFAMQDKDVKGVFLPFHTGGGSVYGCPDTGDLIHQCSKVKPVWTLSEDMAYSAGQWLHAQGSRRLVTQSGGLGSVGVVVAHADMSKMLDDYGINMTLLFDGKHKVDGNPYEALSKTVKDKILADCKKTRGSFASAVSRGTGMSVGDVLSTEAECYTGQDAVDIGFAQEVVSSNTILNEFIEHVNKPKSVTTLGNVMDPNKDKKQADSQATEQQASTTAPAVTEPAQSASEQSQQADERSRIKGIMSCAEAEGRGELANHLAFDTNMSVDEAKGILAVAPKATVAASPSVQQPASDAFAQAMGTEEHPNLSADGVEEHAETGSVDVQASAILADFKAATGVK